MTDSFDALDAFRARRTFRRLNTFKIGSASGPCFAAAKGGGHPQCVLVTGKNPASVDADLDQARSGPARIP